MYTLFQIFIFVQKKTRIRFCVSMSADRTETQAYY